MPRVIKPLTATQLNALKPSSKPYEVADGRNLFITVGTSGTKSFYFRYTSPITKKRTKIALGKHPAISLEKARRKRDEYAALVADNKDPQQEKINDAMLARQRLNNTFEKVFNQWHELHKASVTERTAQKDKRTAEMYLFPYLVDMQIQNITPSYVVDVLQRAYTQGKRQGFKGAMIKRSISILNQVLDYAVNCGMLEFNKCQNVYKAFPVMEVKNHPTIRADELPALLSKINKTPIIDECTKCLIKWQMLTMVRPTEARRAKWEEIDLEKRTWTIPAERMKKRKEHSVPLSDQALKILTHIRFYSGDRPYIFASPKKRFSPLSDKAVSNAIHRLGYAGKQSPHGFRSLASTFLNESLKFAPDVIEAALAYSVAGGVRRIYNRSNYFDERIKMMQYWGDFCEQCGIMELQQI